MVPVSLFSTSSCWSHSSGCASCSIGRGQATPPCAHHPPSPHLYEPKRHRWVQAFCGPHHTSRLATPVLHRQCPLPTATLISATPHSALREGTVVQVDTSRHFCPNPDCAYRGWTDCGNLRANGHPSGGPWRQLLCVACRGYFLSRPWARSFMASAPLSSSSCVSSPAWLRVWASGARHRCSRSTRIRCWGG